MSLETNVLCRQYHDGVPFGNSGLMQRGMTPCSEKRHNCEMERSQLAEAQRLAREWDAEHPRIPFVLHGTPYQPGVGSASTVPLSSWRKTGMAGRNVSVSVETRLS